MNKNLVLEDFTLVRVNKNDLEHLEYLKQLFQNKEDLSMDFLGSLDRSIDGNTFIVETRQLEKIGYFAMSEPVINGLGLSSISLYYATSFEHRGKGYATILLKEVSQYLLEKYDMLVLSIDKKNLASKRVALKSGFQLEFEDEEEEEVIYTKYAKQRNKRQGI